MIYQTDVIVPPRLYFVNLISGLECVNFLSLTPKFVNFRAKSSTQTKRADEYKRHNELRDYEQGATAEFGQLREPN